MNLTQAIPFFKAAFAGYAPSASTFRRWCDRGVKVAGREPIVLRANWVGSSWRVTAEAIQDFAAELNAARGRKTPADASTNA